MDSAFVPPLMHSRRPFTALLVCLLAACAPKTKVDQAAVFSTLEENLQAMQREDLDGVMATIHPAAPDVGEIRGGIEELFAKYDLKLDLRDLKIVNATPDE